MAFSFFLDRECGRLGTILQLLTSTRLRSRFLLFDRELMRMLRLATHKSLSFSFSVLSS